MSEVPVLWKHVFSVVTALLAVAAVVGASYGAIVGSDQGRAGGNSCNRACRLCSVGPVSAVAATDLTPTTTSLTETTTTLTGTTTTLTSTSSTPVIPPPPTTSTTTATPTTTTPTKPFPHSNVSYPNGAMIAFGVTLLTSLRAGVRLGCHRPRCCPPCPKKSTRPRCSPPCLAPARLHRLPPVGVLSSLSQ